MSKLSLVNGLARMTAESSNPTIYDQSYTAVGAITSGTPITLPNSGTYTGLELEVFLNGIRINLTSDFSYVGSGTKTQISMAYNLENNDVLRFCKYRNE